MSALPPWIDIADVAAELSVPKATLRRMARKSEFPELLHVTHGQYRVRRTDYEAWKAARMTKQEMAREELQAERMKAAVAGRYP